MSATTVATEAPKKKRANKELPPAFSKLNEKNFKEFMEFRVEEEQDPSEPGETMVAYSVKIRNEDGVSDTKYELTKFTLDQLRLLARNLGVSYVNKCNKFQCRKALWILANHQEALERDGERLSTATERSSSNLGNTTKITDVRIGTTSKIPNRRIKSELWNNEASP